MDSVNLKTASTYLNNLLLARGLLRNGKIEFARPSRGEGGSEATMAAVINLVHDLILRRDREQDQRESLAETLRTLRTESSRNTQTIGQLETRNEDLARQLSLANSQERSARAALRTAEASAKALREEMARMKTTVQQIRTSCANDIRKRDVQIQKLKTHLTSQQRGNKTGMVGASITIIPGVTAATASMDSARANESPDVEDPGYSLRQETTEFLTQLSQSLSDENDNLIGLVRTTLSTLKEVQGMPENADRAGLSDIPEEQAQDGHMLQALPTSYESLAMDMHNVLENLRSLLTNPNFVPIEEVSAREEEIMRLREGWDKMEARWRDAIALMDSWRKRMLSGGGTVNVEELKQGLGLGQGFGASVALRDETLDSDQDDDMSFDEPADLADIEESPSLEDSVDLVPTVIAHDGRSKDKQVPAKLQPLQESNGNATSPRKVGFAIPKPKENKDSENNGTLPAAATRRLQSTSMKEKAGVSSSSDMESRLPRKTLKRHSSPDPHSEERSTKLTTQEKLNIAQAEAEAAAAVAAGLEVDELDHQLESLENELNTEHAAKADKDTTGRGRVKSRHELASNSRKTKIGGRPRRRKSTLTPEELESLMFVS